MLSALYSVEIRSNNYASWNMLMLPSCVNIWLWNKLSVLIKHALSYNLQFVFHSKNQLIQINVSTCFYLIYILFLVKFLLLYINVLIISPVSCWLLYSLCDCCLCILATGQKCSFLAKTLKTLFNSHSPVDILVEQLTGGLSVRLGLMSDHFSPLL